MLGTRREILFAVAMANVSPHPAVRYRLDDRAHIELRRVLRAMAPPLVIRGVYHSHPKGDPAPSTTDVAEALYPDWLHVIVGMRDGRARMRAYRIRQGRVRAQPLS